MLGVLLQFRQDNYTSAHDTWLSLIVYSGKLHFLMGLPNDNGNYKDGRNR